jgi:hypothetical protein
MCNFYTFEVAMFQYMYYLSQFYIFICACVCKPIQIQLSLTADLCANPSLVESLVRWSEIQTLTFASSLESDAEFVGDTAKRYLALAAGMYRFAHTAADPSQLFALKFGGGNSKEKDKDTGSSTTAAATATATATATAAVFSLAGDERLPMTSQKGHEVTISGTSTTTCWFVFPNEVFCVIIGVGMWCIFCVCSGIHKEESSCTGKASEVPRVTAIDACPSSQAY